MTDPSDKGSRSDLRRCVRAALALPGDFDAVVGASDGALRYFRNTGSSTAAAFLESTGVANPFVSIDVGGASSPDLVDLDGDGDLDAVVGESAGSLRMFANTGSSTAPAFLEQTESANPFADVAVGPTNNPSLVDLDGDGDLDAVIGKQGGHLVFYRNSLTDTFPDGFANGFESGDVTSWSVAVP